MTYVIRMTWRSGAVDGKPTIVDSDPGSLEHMERVAALLARSNNLQQCDDVEIFEVRPTCLRLVKVARLVVHFFDV